MSSSAIYKLPSAAFKAWLLELKNFKNKTDWIKIQLRTLSLFSYKKYRLQAAEF